MTKKCDYCGKEIVEKQYNWKGCIGKYCSPSCAGWSCPYAILQSNGVTYDDVEGEYVDDI